MGYFLIEERDWDMSIIQEKTSGFYQPFLQSEVTGYRELAVGQPFCALFYEFSLTPRTSEKAPDYQELTYIPNGGVDILFVCKNGHKLMEFVGICTQMRSLLAFRGAKYFGVRLYPGIRVTYHGIHLNELTNGEHFFRGCEAPLEGFFEKLEKEESLEEKIRLFIGSFGKNDEIVSEEPEELPRCLVDEISRSHGQLRVSELADRTHYSERHISRTFREAVGISPKKFSRIVRFQYVIGAIISQPQASLTSCLDELGYSDQAHFQREFKEYAGITPGRFLQRMRA